MTAVAALPVITEMNILDTVAGNAAGVVKAVLLAGMAAVACQFLVAPLQGEFGAAVVKAFALVPALGLVTSATVLTQRLGVGILLTVAVNTLSGGFAQRRVLLVTGAALQ